MGQFREFEASGEMRVDRTRKDTHHHRHRYRGDDHSGVWHVWLVCHQTDVDMALFRRVVRDHRDRHRKWKGK